MNSQPIAPASNTSWPHEMAALLICLFRLIQHASVYRSMHLFTEACICLQMQGTCYNASDYLVLLVFFIC